MQRIHYVFRTFAYLHNLKKLKDNRLHRTLVFAVIDALKFIFNDDKMASKVVEKVLKRDKRWGARDRKFIAETIYEMVRWKRLYNEIAGTKEHYTVENLWKNFAVFAVLKGYTLPDWKQLIDTPVRKIKGRFDELSNIRKFKESIPDWLDALGEKEIGKEWDDEIKALNEQAKVILRVNSIKTNRLQLQKQLKE